jgi:Na+/H+ antiporter NhaD/arsenite permease-like protein
MCPDATEQGVALGTGVRWERALAAVGVVGALTALAAATQQARAAAAQTWTPFVLVSGLLLIGLVAEEDGLFRAAGGQLGRFSRSGVAFFLGATLLVIVVTATLNLDTSVVFLTPVLIAATRQRGGAERPLLYGSLLLANASSLFLPGSNLTNLIVLGRHPLSGGGFLALMWPAAVPRAWSPRARSPFGGARISWPLRRGWPKWRGHAWAWGCSPWWRPWCWW